MNVLIIGSGGREHAFAHKLHLSSKCKNLFVCPGNGGTDEIAINVDLDYKDFAAFKQFIIDEKIELVIVGPEQPLVDGIVDQIKSDEALKHIKCVGPSAEAAQLEGSKDYAKAFMDKYQIPTAAYQSFGLDDLEDAKVYIDQNRTPIVLKADGLAAGKGVLIIEDKDEAKQEIEKMLRGKFGEASRRVVIEEFLSGIEFSVFVATDGKSYKILPIAKDYKRIGDGDTGLNTGGMGSISPVPFVDEKLMSKVIERVVEPTLVGIQKEQLDYQGFIFIGLIKVGDDPYVIEYNCRMGDPETQSVFTRLQTDMMDLCTAIADVRLKTLNVEMDERYAATIMLVSEGYPESYEKGRIMKINMDNLDDVQIYHSGTSKKNGSLLTSGGRVIAATALGVDMQAALDKAYASVEKIEFEGRYYRKDIGFDLESN